MGPLTAKQIAIGRNRFSPRSQANKISESPLSKRDKKAACGQMDLCYLGRCWKCGDLYLMGGGLGLILLTLTVVTIILLRRKSPVAAPPTTV